MLGSAAPFDYIHNFWSDQYEHTLQYVGHATKWDDFAVRGNLQDAKLSVSTWSQGLCGLPSASTAAVIPNGNPTPRWRPARSSWPGGPSPIAALLTDEHTDLRSLAG